MSGGGAGPIIIHSLVDSGQIDSADVATLREIADRSVARCSLIDAWRVLRIVWKYLRP